MFFITLIKWKQALTKEMRGASTKPPKRLKILEKQGIKILVHWTLGSYDAVSIMETPTEKDAMKILLPYQDLVDTETMIAVPREEAIKLL